VRGEVDYFQRPTRDEEVSPEPPGQPWYSAPWFVILLSGILAALVLGIAVWIALGGVATPTP
jgi:hypothetical protein